MADILYRIRASIGDLNRTDHAIASFILDNPNEVLHASIADLSRQIGVSQAAIVRFCKMHGLSGYKQLRQEMTNRLLVGVDDTGIVEKGYPAWDLARSAGELVEMVTQNHITSVIDTKMVLDVEALDRAIDMVYHARSLNFFGMGSSGLIAQDAQLKFSRIGKSSSSYVDSHFQLCSAATMCEDDVGIIISSSGVTRDILEVAAVLHDMKVPIVALTAAPKSRLAAYADVILQTCSPENTTYSGAMGTRIAQFTVMDILFCGCITRNKAQAERFLARSYKLTRVKKV